MGRGAETAFLEADCSGRGQGDTLLVSRLVKSIESVSTPPESGVIAHLITSRP